jgi:hypothetical protein
MSNDFFKLDSNIDGTYFDTNNELKVVENMIQIVGATDGPAAYPNSNKLSANFAISELDEIPDLTNVVGTRGHGILYNEKGNPIAYKGDLVFRDKNNTITLNGAISKANSISVRGNDVALRDKSLQEFNSSQNGVSLDDMIEASLQNSSSTGGGNIIEAIRNEELNTTFCDVFTIRLSSENSVWISCCALMKEAATLRLRDVSTGIVLDTAYIEPTNGNIMPVYLSYVGSLQKETEIEVTANECSPIIWNSFLKKHFKEKDFFEQVPSHQIRLEVVENEETSETPTFIKGNVNMLVMDDNVSSVVVYNGESIVDNKDTVDILFEEMPSLDFSISIQAETPVQVWYDQKSTIGFKIRFERPYNGRVFWSAILKVTT